MFKLSLKYALICGVFLLIIFVLFQYMGTSPLINLNHLLVDLVVFGVFMFFALKEYRVYHNEGYLHLWQGMTMGFVIYAIGSILFSAGLYLYLEIKPEEIANYQAQALNFLSEKSEIYIKEFGEAGYQEQIKVINEVTVWDLIKGAGVKKILAGLFVTPVISIILRKQLK